jgi:hypothetical protein
MFAGPEEPSDGRLFNWYYCSPQVWYSEPRRGVCCIHCCLRCHFNVDLRAFNWIGMVFCVSAE